MLPDIATKVTGIVARLTGELLEETCSYRPGKRFSGDIGGPFLG